MGGVGSKAGGGDAALGAGWYDPDIERVLITEEQIAERTDELAQQVATDYAPVQELLLVCVLKGAVIFVADLARALGRTGQPVQLEFLQASSYGQGTSSSGVVRLLKDLDRDISGMQVLVVEDIVDSGLTLSWLLRYLASRSAASVEVITLFRKPAAMRSAPPLKYVGFDLPADFVVGYGLDYAGRYREMPYVGVLKPEVYRRA
jgi:hypoxanthine phosphoribosyltransferase